MARIQLGAAKQTKEKERRMLWIALGLGLLAFLLNVVFIRNMAGKRIQVLRAKETILAGAKFRRDLFEVIAISGDLEQMNKTFLNADDAPAYEREQKPLAITMQPGELLSLRSLNNDFKLIPPPGKHAVTMPVPNEIDTGGQLLRAGQAVNIYTWYNNKEHLLRAGACLAAVGDLPRASVTNEGREVRYRTVTIFVDPDEVEALLTNANLAGERVQLTLVGDCDPKREQKAAPALNAMPEPTPLPTPTPAPKKRRR